MRKVENGNMTAYGDRRFARKSHAYLPEIVKLMSKLHRSHIDKNLESIYYT